LISTRASLTLNAPAVVSETRDGEAIIMHHGSGSFFNTLGAGAVLWEQIERGATPASLAASLVRLYALDGAHADAATQRFLGLLTTHDLIAIGPESVTDPAAFPPQTPVGAFEEPELGVHTDLADMLLLDPIHEVDAVGWPIAAPARA
jgi:hypothetical protein